MKLLLFSPIVLALSTYMAVVYGYLYLLFTTITEVYEGQYHFGQGTVGLTYLGIGVGSLIGVIIFGIASDKILQAKSKNGEMKAEYRLPPMIPGSFVIPIGCEPTICACCSLSANMTQCFCMAGRQRSTSFGLLLLSVRAWSESAFSQHSCPFKRILSTPSPYMPPPPLPRTPCFVLSLVHYYRWLDKRCTTRLALGGETHCWHSLRLPCVLYRSYSTDTAKGSERIRSSRLSFRILMRLCPFPHIQSFISVAGSVFFNDNAYCIVCI